MTPNPQDSAVALEVERAAFEAWAKPLGDSTWREKNDRMLAWDAWQARASQSDGTSGGWQAIAGHDPLRELHDLLYAAQRIEGEQRDRAISRARVIVHHLRDSAQSSLTPEHLKGTANQGENHVG